MEKFRKEIQRIISAKKARRKTLAQLSIEEKIQILLELQKMAGPIYQARGIWKRSWEI